MAKTIDCPTCAVTIRLTAELFARRIEGRRVKSVCKACRQPFYVDATGPALKVSLRPPQNHVPLSSLPLSRLGSDPAIPRAPRLPSSRAPLPHASRSGAHTEDNEPPLLPRVPARAAALIEEELPTRPLNERPFLESEAPAPFYEPPPTSRSLTMPPLPTQASPALLEALAARRPSRVRPLVASLALFAAGAAAFALWPSVSDWVVTLAGSSGGAEPSQEANASVSQAKEPKPARVEVSAPMEGAEPPRTPTSTSVTTAAARAEGASPVSEKHTPSLPTQAARATQAPSREAVPGTAPEVPSAVENEGEVVAAPTGEEATTAPSEMSSGVPAEGDVAEAAPLGPFDTAAAVTALSVAALQSGSCRKAGDPTGMARVVVTFAPSGRATSSTVSGPPFAGTSTGGCIASQFRALRVPPFEGPLVTVAKSVVVQ